jgi:hypothetical protein
MTTPTAVTVTWNVPDASLGALGGSITFQPVAVLTAGAGSVSHYNILSGTISS